jgi:hypothetical protein
MKSYKYIILFSTILSPGITLAVDCNATPQTISDVFTCFSIGNMSGLIPSLLIIAVVTFMTGVIKYVGAGDNEEKRQAGRQVMIYGVITLFVMVSLWGFVNILTNTFFGEEKGLPNYLPQLQ